MYRVRMRTAQRTDHPSQTGLDHAIMRSLCITGTQYQFRPEGASAPVPAYPNSAVSALGSVRAATGA